ncbi:hypothetical protein LC962_09415, partial [Enterococcus faecium]|nr:hypothetical protein [Enterococcus faecium]
IIGNPSLNHRYRKGFYSLFKTLQQNRWFIPKRFRGKINAGDQVKVLNRNSTDVVMITDIYVEDEVIIKYMKPVIKLVNKNKGNG